MKVSHKMPNIKSRRLLGAPANSCKHVDE